MSNLKIKIELTKIQAETIERQLRYTVQLFGTFLMHDGWDEDATGKKLKNQEFMNKVKNEKQKLDRTAQLFTKAILKAE